MELTAISAFFHEISYFCFFSLTLCLSETFPCSLFDCFSGYAWPHLLACLWKMTPFVSTTPGQESEYQWRNPSSWYWRTHVSTDKETCDHLDQNFSDWSWDYFGPYWLQNMRTMDDGWNAWRRLPPPPPPPSISFTRQSSWQPYPDTSAPKSPWVSKNMSSTCPQTCRKIYQWPLSPKARQHL